MRARGITEKVKQRVCVCVFSCVCAYAGKYEECRRLNYGVCLVFVEGDCLITVATGEMSKSQADRAGLVPTHAYAVLDMQHVNVSAREKGGKQMTACLL